MAKPTHAWLDNLLHAPSMGQLVKRLNQAPRKRLVAQGSQGSSATLLTGALAIQLQRPVLLVVAHLDDADHAMEDLALWRQAGHALDRHSFGALEVLPGETNTSLELLAERLALVQKLNGSHNFNSSVIVTPIAALMQAVPLPKAMEKMALTLKVGSEYSPGNLAAWLTDAGYQRIEGIEQPGDFSVRGGIVDIYPPSGSNEDPIRLDYFGDEIDSICCVDPDTLGSGTRLKQIQLIGAKVDGLQNDDQTTSLWSLLPDNLVVVMHEVMELSEQARGYFERLTNPVGIYSPNAVFRALTARPHLEINQYSSVSKDEQAVTLPVGSLAPFARQASDAVKELGELCEDPTRQVIVLCPQQAEHDRLTALIQEHLDGTRPNLHVCVGYLHRGFRWQTDAGELALIPHQELFHRYDLRSSIRRLGSTHTAASRATDAFLDLSPGDYVVHADHGVAIFRGLRHMKHTGKTSRKGQPPSRKTSKGTSGGTSGGEEFLTLEFASRLLLHVPVFQIDRVSRYIGGFEGKPALAKIGGKRWDKQKEQVQEAVKDMAGELLRVQAARAAMPGISFGPDTPWQTAFEAAFPYEETEDQLVAIAATKKDMATHRPMDRLICGDVGFGKTEVAIRAAFKVAQHGKQVAVLVPTTVLAEQHERTFRSRMADYPFRIEALSRFKTTGEQKQTIERLAQGQIDIIIGTHRLLSEDIRFADLGMVIIDEEQRFGVEHKNRLLQFRLTADVMTLSATPIPRTLHMSMLGLRDISSLTMAPADRRAIVTEVISYDENRIQQAIIREMNRDGQTFFLHNRVGDIQSVAADVKRLVPDARVIIGHGQMGAHELEKVMLKFIRREADVLVCTTIIESGIDIPTANTILIDRADHFGLAELHQLRGRVGRYKHRAYCYLMLSPDRPVTDKAAKRLRAIEQYNMLGAGFKIAMRDLEIRGAGNILGAEQSGHIAAVGYDMYCQLLEQASKRLRRERVVEPTQTHLELHVSGQLPKSYISSDKFRMEAYRRLSRAVSMEEFKAVIGDLTDAYGKPPPQAQLFIDLLEIRLAAALLDVDALNLQGPDLIFRTHKPQVLMEVLKDAPGRVSLIDETTVYFRPPTNYLKPIGTLLAILRKLLVRPAMDQNG